MCGIFGIIGKSNNNLADIKVLLDMPKEEVQILVVSCYFKINIRLKELILIY